MRFKISDLSFKGFSLIEVMIVLGLLGGVATIVMSLTKQTASTQKKFQTDIDADFIVKEISGFLASSDNCFSSEIRGKNASTTAAGSITKVKNYKADSVTSYGASNIKVASFALSNTNFDEIYDTNTETSLVINFIMPKIVSTTVPTIKPRRIKLVITKTGANVETCMSAWVNQQDYWTKILSTNDIFYNSGKVGIGTPTPQTTLHVKAPPLSGTMNTVAIIEGTNTNNGGTDNVLIKGPFQTRLTISGTGEDYLGGKATYSSLVLENSANLGNHWFIAYKGGAAANLPKDGLTIGKYNTPNPGNKLPFYILNILKEGFIGINTVTPHHPLHVMGGIVSETAGISYTQANGFCATSPPSMGCIGTVANPGDYGGLNAKIGDFSISSTQNIQFVPGLVGWGATVPVSHKIAMTILSDGKIGMGKLAPTANLEVETDAKIGTTLTVGGNVTVGGTVTSNSDERLKKDFASIPHALEKILSFKGIFYRWKDESKGKNLQLGFKAQEVEKVFPEVVSTDDKGFKSVAYQNLIAPVVEAIRELYNKVTSALVSVFVKIDVA